MLILDCHRTNIIKAPNYHTKFTYHYSTNTQVLSRLYFASSCHVADRQPREIAATLWWFTAALKPLKIQVFWGSPSPQGSYSPYILGDTARPGHVTCVLVWSKSDRRRLRKTLHKQTDRQTDKQTLRKLWSLGREPITLRCQAAATIRHTAEWLTSNSGSSVSDKSSSASSGTSRRLWAIILSRSAIEFKSLVFLPTQCTSNHQPSHIKKLCYHRRAVRCATPVEISSTAAQLYKNCILKSLQ